MQFQETKSRELQLLEEDRKKKLEAQNVFKQTKWGRVLSVVKSNVTESLQKKSDQHVHHHHHFHHYYHHEHVVQSPQQNRGPDIPRNPTVVVSVCHTPPVIHDETKTDPPRKPTVHISHRSSISQPPPVTSDLSQEPNDSIISLEMTSNCKISQTFLSPTSPYSGRHSPTWSIESVSSEQVRFSPDAASLCSNEDLAATSAFSSVGKTDSQLSSPSILTPYNPSSSVAIQHHSSLTIPIHRYPLPSITFDHHQSLSIHRFPSLPIIIHHYPTTILLLTIIIHGYYNYLS